MNSKHEFKEYVKRSKGEKEIRLFWDIETFQFNEEEGRKKPTLYKNCAFSVAVSWWDNLELKRVLFPDFKEVFLTIIEGCKNTKNSQPSARASFNLIAHNNNKYDNHYLLKDLIYYFPSFERKNMYLSSAVNNDMTVRKTDLKKKEDKQYLILEKRVKSSNNLVLDIYFKGIHFFTTDNWVKTNLPLRVLGQKLFKKDLIEKKHLKTTFDYKKYNVDYDMSEDESHAYARYIYDNLSKDELIYIENDVILLALAVRYYSIIFPNFDFEKMTFTSNILEFYKTNELTIFQLLNQYGEGKSKLKINYTDYRFSNENFYDFVKSFYRGGLNFYNYKYLGIIIKNLFSIDINSSYPYVMYDFGIPTFLNYFQEYETEKEIQVNYSKNKYYMYRMDKETFNETILLNIESNVIKQMLVKYYNVNEFVNINSYTLRMISELIDLPIMKIKVIAYLEYDCVPFGSKEQIFENYKIKTQGKLENKIIMDSPMDYKILDEKNTNMFSQEEIDNSKVLLNGLYGIPALKAYFNLFRLLPNNDLESIPNGYKNNERNLVFSVFVTSVALYNLLSPLTYLTQEEIDDYFVYCDTDSLYLKKEAFEKIPNTIYDKISLGKWDIEHKNIEYMYVLNHKKYSLYDSDSKKIIVKCGGIDLSSFAHVRDRETKQLIPLNKQLYSDNKKDENYNIELFNKQYEKISFQDFIDSQFHHGAKIKNTKSIYTAYGTIAIYESTTEIEKGKNYPYFFTKLVDEMRMKLIKQVGIDIKEEGFVDDVLYIESELGVIGQSEVYPIKNPIQNKNNLILLKSINNKIKSLLSD